MPQELATNLTDNSEAATPFGMAARTGLPEADDVSGSRHAGTPDLRLLDTEPTAQERLPRIVTHHGTQVPDQADALETIEGTVTRIQGKDAYIQCTESTRMLKVHLDLLAHDGADHEGAPVRIVSFLRGPELVTRVCLSEANDDWRTEWNAAFDGKYERRPPRATR